MAGSLFTRDARSGPPPPTLSADPCSRVVRGPVSGTHRRTPNRPIEEDPVAESYTGDAYCVKCKEKRDFTGEVKVSESGRRMAQGICPVCGTKLNRILGKA